MLHRPASVQSLVLTDGLRAGATDGEGDARRTVGRRQRAERALDLVAEAAAKDALDVEPRQPAQEIRFGRRDRLAADELVRQRKAGERDALARHAVGDE